MAEARVLIIEDNPVNMELAQDLLEIRGYEVLSAYTAEEGLRMARAEVPDIVLMDISLPGMDGLEATRLLKQDPITMNIPVVCLTAHAMEGDKEKALGNGASGYIIKPLNTREFADQIASYLNQ